MVFFLLGNFCVNGQQLAKEVANAKYAQKQSQDKAIFKNTLKSSLNSKQTPLKNERIKSEPEPNSYVPLPKPQAGPLEAQKNKKEDLSKRDISSKHFINDDGSYTALIGGGPIHYDNNGTWEDINHSITTNNNPQYPYSNTTNLLESYFGATAHLGARSNTKEGEVKEFLNTKMYWEVNGQAVDIQNSQNTSVTINGSKAYYNNLFGTIAAEYSILSGKRKLNYIIPNAQAFGNMPNNAQYLVFSEDIVLPSGWTHRVDKQKGILINDASGETIYAYENPTVYEDYHGELVLHEQNNPASFEIKKTNNTITLFLKVETSWLKDANRIFPLAIDPTVMVYPDNANFWSGWVNSNGAGANGNMRVGHTNSGAEIDAFVKFNLTSIQAGSTVSSVTSHLFRYGGVGSHPNRQMTIGSSNVDPVTAVFWADIYNGYTGDISNSVSANNGNGWKVNTFNPTGITFIENALADGFASILAWPSSNEWTNNNYDNFGGYSHENPPYLTIDYTVTEPCSPTSEEPDGLYINSVSIVGTLSDPPTNTSTYNTTGFEDFTTLPQLAVQADGEGVNIIASSQGSILSRGTWKAWVDWNQNEVFEPSEEVYNIFGFVGSNVTFGFEIPDGQIPGDYRLRIRVNNSVDYLMYYEEAYEGYGFDFSPCDVFEHYYYGYEGFPYYDDIYKYNFGETEDYLFTVIANCDAVITNIIDSETCNNGAVTLNVTASPGTTINWYYNETDTTPFQNTPQGDWTTPVLSSTTSYWVTATNGSCESIVKTEITAKVNPTPTVTFNPETPVICGNDIIQLTAGGDIELAYLIDEDFESGGLGAFNNYKHSDNLNNNLINDTAKWQNRESVYVPGNNVNVWYPAISSGFGSDKFALALSDTAPTPPNSIVHNSLELVTPVDATDFLNLTLNLKLYYSRYFQNGSNPDNEYVAIELSTDGGLTYPIEIQKFTNTVGYGSKFHEINHDLSTYIGESNLSLRIRHYSEASENGWLGDGVAVDDIKLYGDKPLNTAFTYDPSTVDAFTDAAATIPYTPGTQINSIYIRPTIDQLENATFHIPVSATLSNGCEATGTALVTNNTKIFKSPYNDWNNDSNWSPPGVPTLDNCVIIPNGQESSVDGTLLHAEALNVTVKNGGILHLEPEYMLTVQDWINVENTGVFNIKNSASLIQINDLTTKPNSGNVHVQRAPKDDFSPVDNLNYVYWSSPVKGFNVGNISPNTSASLIWQWIPTITENGSGNHGDWQNATGTMIDGTGYIVRGLSGTPTVLPPATTIPVSNNTALFTGVPNNGEIVVPINRGNYTGLDYIGNGNTATAQDDNWNLLGNPYPSSISANKFVNLNSHISGTIYLWPHTALPSAANNDPFYGDYGLNYDNIYIEHNPTGTIPPTVGDLNIASGQAFMVLMMDTAGLSESVLFNNSLRDKSQANNSFYRQEVDTPEKHRIWLDLAGSDNKGHTLLVGYIANATNDYDRLYDGYNFLNQPTNFYSLIGESTYSIQGRALPFSQDDTIPLGFTISENDSFTIGINTIDGLFESTNQGIFLEDTYMNIIHDLRIAPYSFKSDAGTYNDRFILRYTNAALSIADQQTLNNLSITAPNNSYIKVSSDNNLIKSVSVFDVLGRELFSNDSINNSDFILNNMALSKGTYVVKATLENGIQKVEKVILK
ncbi:hypothetical protein GCM10008085_20260 [Winogradskyella epiphytica]|nr:hypothetical protein GCM10008085_20260 [Winogradskyella epiphytica]